MFDKNLATLALCILPTFAAPSPLVKVRKATESVDGQYIVTLKDGADRQTHINSCSNVTHQWDIINGFAGHFTDDEVRTLSTHPEVRFIEENSVVRVQSIATQYAPSTT